MTYESLIYDHLQLGNLRDNHTKCDVEMHRLHPQNPVRIPWRHVGLPTGRGLPQQHMGTIIPMPTGFPKAIEKVIYSGFSH